MWKRVIIALFIFFVIQEKFTFPGFASFKKIEGDVQDTLQPKLFGEGIISTTDDEFGGTMSPDGKLFFFCKKSPSTGRSNLIVICFAENINGQWANASIAPFSGTYRDFNPQFSADVSIIYFMSTRPVTGEQPKQDSDIWFVEKTATGWSEAKHLDGAVNSQYVEYSCSFANNGDMYLSSARDGKSIDIYLSKLVDGEYQQPQPLNSTVNTQGPETDAYIAPDGSYLLFTSAGRDDMLAAKNGAVYPRSDIYISYNQNGKWTKAQRLPEPVNSTADDNCPSISRDGKTLFFTSKRGFVTIPMNNKLSHNEFEKQLHGTQNNFGNIYSISTGILTQN